LLQIDKACLHAFFSLWSLGLCTASYLLRTAHFPLIRSLLDSQLHSHGQISSFTLWNMSSHFLYLITSFICLFVCLFVCLYHSFWNQLCWKTYPWISRGENQLLPSNPSHNCLSLKCIILVLLLFSDVLPYWQSFKLDIALSSFTRIKNSPYHYFWI